MTQPPYGAPPPPPPPYGAPAAGGPYFISAMGQEHGPYELAQVGEMARTGTLKPDAMVRSASSPNWFPAKEVPGVFSDKDMVVTAIISWLVGVFGVDRFYLGYTGLGLLKLFTCGGLGIWALIDLILIILRKVPDADGRPLR